MVFLPYYRWQNLQILNIDADKEIIVISCQTLELTMNEGSCLIILFMDQQVVNVVIAINRDLARPPPDLNQCLKSQI